MSSIITTAREFRADVLRNDKAMLRQLSQAYSSIDRSLNRQLRDLMRDIVEAEKAGKTVNQDWLRRSFRYQQLIRQVKGELSAFSLHASHFIEGKQYEAIRLGQSHASDLIQQVTTSFVRLPTGAIEELVGVMQNGSPLNTTLNKLGPQVAKQIKQTLITGLGSGHGAAKIAQGIRQAISIPRWRALAISRTEVMRAYRQSTLQTYAENDDVISGWIWISTQSVRTCAACWALHGTFFPLSKTFFPAHVSCRCTSIPEIRGVKTNVPSGSVLFADLPVAQQQTILGPSRYEMYQQGTALDDFVILTRDADWGGAYQVRPLWKMRQKKKAA